MMGAHCAKSTTPAGEHPAAGLTPSDALRVHFRSLTSYEREEIHQYGTVYFVGERARKIHAVDGLPSNGGYDDSNSRYLAKKHDHVAYRYEIVSGLGKGAFGDVYRALDHRTNQEVALKIIRNERRFHRQGKVEVKVLDILRSQDTNDDMCCVHMIDYFIFRGHLCITFEMHHNDLYTELKAGGFSGLDPAHVRDITGNTLQCLGLLAKNNIVHADLKPENMLIESPGSKRVKVIDLGSSCFVHEKVHTYIQSRYYRSPEVMLGLGYSTAIDMWSLGCIMVELTTGSPIFPAKNEHELVTLQTEVLGVPPRYLLDRATRADEFFARSATGYKPLRYTDRKGRRRSPGGRTLEDACHSADPRFVDFVARCLTWDPADRMTPDEALSHPYILSEQRAVRRSYSEDGLVAMLTKAPTNPSLSETSSKSGSNKSLNDSGISTEASESGEDYINILDTAIAV